MTRATAVAISVFLISGWTGVSQAGGKVGIDPGAPANKGQNAAERKSQKPIPPQAGKKERAPKSTIKQKVMSDNIGETRRRTGIDPQGTEAQGVEQ